VASEKRHPKRISHREALHLLAVAVWNSYAAVSLILGALILFFLGSLPEPQSKGFAFYLRTYFDPYLFYLALGLIIVALYIALRGAIADDRLISVAQIDGLQRVLQNTSNELEDVLKPRGEIVLINDCCVKSGMGLVAIGVAAKPSKSLLAASVYADIASVGYQNRVLAWANPRPDPEKAIDIHPGQHHHTQWFAVVGDPPGNRFHFSLGYESPQEVSAGRYEVTVYVKARDAMMIERKVEITFTAPRGVSAHLL
jgi:hypothetical protein